MTRSKVLVFALSLALAYTLGRLSRPDPAADRPGPDYAAHVATALEAISRPAGSGARHSFVDVAARLRPSVVSIAGVRRGSVDSGTGVVVDARGFILTNLHVVDGLDPIEVTLSSKDRFRAVVVGADDSTCSQAN